MDKGKIEAIFKDLLSSYEDTRRYSIYNNSSEPEEELRHLKNELDEYELNFKEVLDKLQ